MTNWLSIPEQRVKQQVALKRQRKQQLESLLAFVQKSQPATTMDFVVEEVLTRYMARGEETFPVPDETEKMSCTLPESLASKIEALVEVRKETCAEANASHLWEHALDQFFGRSSKLRNAWKKDLKAAQQADTQTSTATRTESAPTVREETLSVSRTQSVTSPHAQIHRSERPIEPSQKDRSVQEGMDLSDTPS